MKIKNYIFKLFISLISLPGICYSQDARFSQFDANPLSLNPALTGVGIEQSHLFRAVANYHQKKTNLTDNMYSASVDFLLNDKLSFGQLVVNRKLDNIYNNTHFLLSCSYNITGSKTKALLVGLQAGIVQTVFNINNYTFDSQYSSLSNDGFDLNLSTGESFHTSNLTRLDVNAGVVYKNDDINKKLRPFASAGIFHITQANQSITNVINPAPMRFNFNAGVDYYINNKIHILPQLLWINQSGINEVNAGIYFYDKLNDSIHCEPMLGLVYTVNNRITTQLGFRYKNVVFRVSYDINTTPLKQYESNNIEVSLIYYMRKKQRSVGV